MRTIPPPFTLVTGATGAVGPSIVCALIENGCRVRTLSLDAPPKLSWPEGVDVRLGDVTDRSTVQRALQDVGAVIHLAALLHEVDPLAETWDKYERVNVGATATLLAAAIEAGVRRVVLASTIAVYGPSGGLVLNEESETCPDTFYGRTKLAAEKIVLQAKRADGAPLGTVLRFAAVYGARVKGNYQRLLQALARNRFVALGDGANRRTLIYDKDLAQAVVLAIAHPAAAGQIFNVTDGRFHTLKEIIEAVSLALGRPTPRFTLPVKPMRWLAGILEDAAKWLGHASPIGRHTIDKVTEDIAVSGDKIRRMLDFHPGYDLLSGWWETVEAMRRAGAL